MKAGFLSASSHCLLEHDCVFVILLTSHIDAALASMT